MDTLGQCDLSACRDKLLRQKIVEITRPITDRIRYVIEHDIYTAPGGAQSDTGEFLGSCLCALEETLL
jgi:hypothetical protein